MRRIRREFEESYPEADRADYSVAAVALEPFQNFDLSTLAVVSADLSQLAQTPTGQLNVKVAVIGDVASPSADDFLSEMEQEWHLLPISDDAIGYVGLPEVLPVAPGAEEVFEFVKGGAGGELILYMPHNRSNFSNVLEDGQSVTIEAEYSFD